MVDGNGDGPAGGTSGPGELPRDIYVASPAPINVIDACDGSLTAVLLPCKIVRATFFIHITNATLFRSGFREHTILARYIPEALSGRVEKSTFRNVVDA
jgi:hypothetical protein